MGKWLLGIIILALVALFATTIWPWNAMKRSAAMGTTIQSTLQKGGYNLDVDMDGNVARLSGVVKSEAQKNAATDLASNVKCEQCKNKNKQRSWHRVVNNDVTVEKGSELPTKSPYTFTATKAKNDKVVLNGYVRNEAERTRILNEAEALFPGAVSDNKVRIANGAPNEKWIDTISANVADLHKLDTGRYTLQDTQSLLRGTTSDASLRDAINSRVSGLKSLGYSPATNITVPQTAAANVGEIKSQAVCQEIFDDLKGDNKINFIVNRAEIRGAKSFDLLNSIASASKQCSAFRVAVTGHTDSDGNEAYNQQLSEARANNVVAYLVTNGVELSQLTASGMGETSPIAGNDTAAGKAQNRRIEFVVTQAE